MTTTVRTIIGGCIASFTYVMMVITSVDEVLGSLTILILSSALTAYLYVYRHVASRSWRLGASLAVVPIYFFLAWVPYGLTGGWILTLPALQRVSIAAFLNAVAFMVAVAIVNWVASKRKVKLAIT